MSDHDDVAAYLLGALDEREQTAFEAHLEECDECRDAVVRLRVAADALPASPPQLAPPPELKDRIMAIVRSEAELLQAAGAQADAPPPRERRRRSWWPPRPAMALAGAVAVLVVGVLVGIGLGGSDSLRTVTGKTTVAGAKAKLIERDSGHSTLLASKLPGAGPGRVYQVWLQRDGGKPIPTNALFSVRQDGSASVDVPGSLKGIKTVMVSSEPDGGSQQPTRTPVIVIST